MPINGAFILPHPPLIVPQVGKGQERKIQRTIDSYEEAARRIAALKPETVIVATPHSVMYSDYFHISPGLSATGNLGQFAPGTPKIHVEYDCGFVSELERKAADAGLSAGTQGERSPALDHATYIPLYFVNKEYKSYKLVRIGISGLPFQDHYRLGRCIAEVSEKLKRNVVFIASADLSHRLDANGPYGLSPEGPLFDSQITEAMSKGDFLQFLSFPYEFSEKAGECGLRSCIMMAGALDRMNVKSELLSYEGPFGVGYGIASFLPDGKGDSRDFLGQYLEGERKRLDSVKESEDEYVSLARQVVEHFAKTGKRPGMPAGLPAEMLSNRAGVFVSIKKHGALRGCIGTISPVKKNIAEEICRNAVSAASEDPRFDSVQPSELDDLTYSVDVLAEPEPITSPSELDATKYGVIVSSGCKRGLLLPNLEGVDTVKQQIEIAKQKAGISKLEPCSLERFEVVRHK
ncbi:MAG: AmmeMemoRadiSam system protein A [Clostridiales bacterium]|nr:AmmeMemoRadiSam system protein A [Clostridiales bacterium]